MADTGRTRYHNSIYNYGSTVFQPERRSEKEKRAAEREYIRNARQLIEEKVSVKKVQDRKGSLLRTAVSAVLIVLIAAVFCMYIMQISANRNVRSEITALEKQYQTLNRENALKQNAIEKGVDYDSVYRIATGVYGMRVPEKQQIIYYQADQNEYVVKAGEIPHE